MNYIENAIHHAKNSQLDTTKHLLFVEAKRIEMELIDILMNRPNLTDRDVYMMCTQCTEIPSLAIITSFNWLVLTLE